MKNKPLPIYEQSMFLVAMLFDRKNLPEIMKFLPDKQRERLVLAKEKFDRLPQKERLTQIVLELRRLLLIDENRIDWIHPSWMEDALLKEPAYLREIISQNLAKRPSDPKPKGYIFPTKFIFSTFLTQIRYSPPKTISSDPILMRLQSISEDIQTKAILHMGRYAIGALAVTLAKNRFLGYLRRKSPESFIDDKIDDLDNNPFRDQNLRQQFLRLVIGYTAAIDLNISLFMGLMILGFFLASHKSQWQRTIILGLPKALGTHVEKAIAMAEKIGIDSDNHGALSAMLQRALKDLDG